MKKAKRLEELRDFTVDELQEELAKAEESLFKLRYSAATEQTDNLSAVKDKKKDIARIKTILRTRLVEAEAKKGS